ncbi:hypothetical protein [uncultured Desulfovibrio sp.]|uniref:hypothetical protein n=1 Tax=uncultured Desulfovibrio sp. TaxID=167968 RepID=UPI00262951FC|nr:hypothetical protein [uncultured Desulfovibrio sp.]
MRTFSPYPLVRGEWLFFIGKKQRFFGKRGDISPFFDKREMLRRSSEEDGPKSFTLYCLSEPMKKLQRQNFMQVSCREIFSPSMQVWRHPAPVSDGRQSNIFFHAYLKRKYGGRRR